jgi:hypothetical protein
MGGAEHIPDIFRDGSTAQWLMRLDTVKDLRISGGLRRCEMMQQDTDGKYVQ